MNCLKAFPDFVFLTLLTLPNVNEFKRAKRILGVTRLGVMSIWCMTHDNLKMHRLIFVNLGTRTYTFNLQITTVFDIDLPKNRIPGG